MSQSLENTVFTFAAILAVYLLGQAAGAALIRVRVDILLPLLSGAVGLSTWIFASSGTVYETMRHSFGDSASAVACAEILTAFAVFALPTLLMGALFAQLADRAGERSLGRALLWNSLGAAVGAVVVPTVLFPKIGAFTTLALIAMSYVVFVQKWSVASIAAVVAALALIGFAPRPLTLAHVPPGSVLREIRSGRMATVTVAESPDGNRTLFVNNRFQMGGTAAAIPELRHGHIPLLLHPAPHRALFLGLGTGITISSAAAHPDLRADGVELLPEVVAVMPHFFPNAADSPLHATNISIHVADARRFIRETTNRYDVIVADLFHPAQDGAAFLYTREHFLRIRERLADDGLFCQWLPLHQLDLQTFRDITRTFMAVFPNAEAWLLRFNIDAPVVGLIGWKGSRPALTTNWVEPRATSAVLGRQLRRVALADSIRLFGSYLAGSDSLRAFGGDGPVNLDTFPIVMFEAPAFSYQRKAPTHERLLALIRQIPQRSPAIANPALAEKVSRYIAARDVYLNGLVAESSGDRVTALDDYIESARLSEEFTSGYAQCLAIASAESKTKPEETRKLLRRLVEAQPNRPVAKEMLERLSR